MTERHYIFAQAWTQEDGSLRLVAPKGVDISEYEPVYARCCSFHGLPGNPSASVLCRRVADKMTTTEPFGNPEQLEQEEPNDTDTR